MTYLLAHKTVSLLENKIQEQQRSVWYHLHIGESYLPFHQVDNCSNPLHHVLHLPSTAPDYGCSTCLRDNFHTFHTPEMAQINSNYKQKAITIDKATNLTHNRRSGIRHDVLRSKIVIHGHGCYRLPQQHRVSLVGCFLKY